jgi:glycosyltransferase involved in cell wall biosynthesis
VKYIYWFAYYKPALPSVRYRSTYPLAYLKANYGIDYSIAYPGYDLRSIGRFISMYFSALLFRKRDSIIVIQKVNTRRIYATALRILVFFRSNDTMYDLDDALYVDHRSATINWFLKNCSACSMASDTLVRYARKFNGNVFLLTSPVIDHQEIKTERSPVFTIGWIGCYGGEHKEALFRLLFPALKQTGFDIRLVILGVTSEQDKTEIENFFSLDPNIITDVPTQMTWMDERSVYSRIREFDLGISTLLDSESHRSKSAFKLKQYFSCGVPALASEIGENSRFLDQGRNGFFCNTMEEYKKRIRFVKDMNDADYHALSLNAKASTANFSLDHYCRNLIGFFN